jgi:WD40 repeat protein
MYALLHALAAQTLPPPEGAGLAPADLGAFLAMQDGYVRLLDAASGAERARLSGAGNKLASLVFTADGSRLIGGRNDGRIVVWDLASGREIARLEDFSGRVYALALTADGYGLVSGAMDGSVRLWYRATSDEPLCLPFDHNEVEDALNCHLCCYAPPDVFGPGLPAGDACNLDTNPPRGTLYRP